MWPFKRRIRKDISEQWFATIRAKNEWRSERNTLKMRVLNATNGELRKEFKLAQKRGALVLARYIEKELIRRGE